MRLTLLLLLGTGYWYVDRLAAMVNGEHRVLAAIATYVLTFCAIGVMGGLVEAGLHRLRPSAHVLPTMMTCAAAFVVAWLGMSTLGTNLPFRAGRANLFYAIAIALLLLGAAGKSVRFGAAANRLMLGLALAGLIPIWAWIFPEKNSALEPSSFLISATAMALLWAAASALLRDASLKPRPLAITLVALLGAAPIVHFAARQRVPSMLEQSASTLLSPFESARGPSRPADVVLIVWDTVRRDHLSLYGYSRSTTPYLESAAADRVIYTRAISVAPWTLPAHASMFSGLYPHEHGMHGPGTGAAPAEHSRLHVAPERLTTLAEILRDAGYATGAVSANTAFVSRATNLDQGFDTFVDADNQDHLKYGFEVHDALLANVFDFLPAGFAHTYGLPYASAEEITRLGLDWLESQPRDRPKLLFLNYMDAHEPRYPPSDLIAYFRDPPPIGSNEAAEAASEIVDYDRTILHLDRELERLESELKARDLFDRSLILLTSDHGEFMGDHGLTGHGLHLYAGNIDIPLVVRFPAGKPAGTDPRLIENRDVFSLILEAIGLVPASDRKPGAFSEHYGTDTRPTRRAVVFDDYKLIAEEGGSDELYDLSRDPRELTDLAARVPDQADVGRNLLAEFFTAADAEADRNREQSGRALTAEEDERLRALGYIE